MIVQVTNKDVGDKVLSIIPLEKYPYADPMWKLKLDYFTGKYLLAAEVVDDQIKAVMLYYFADNTCYIHILYAPNMLLNGYKELWDRFEQFIGRDITFRFWTAYPKQFSRMTNAIPLYTMMEMQHKGKE